MVSQRLSAISGVSLSSYPIMYEVPDTFIIPHMVAVRPVVPWSILKVESMRLGQIAIELEDEQVSEIFIAGTLLHDG